MLQCRLLSVLFQPIKRSMYLDFFFLTIEPSPFCVDVVYDPEVTLSLIGVLQKLSASKANGKNPEIYIAFTIRNPDTYHLFQTELGRCLAG